MLNDEEEPPNGIDSEYRMSLAELDLKLTLKRVQPPKQFAESVLRRVAVSAGSRGRARAGSSCRLALAATLLLALTLAGAALVQRHQRQQQQAKRVAERFAVAMRVTQTALTGAGYRLNLHKAAQVSLSAN